MEKEGKKGGRREGRQIVLLFASRERGRDRGREPTRSIGSRGKTMQLELLLIHKYTSFRKRFFPGIK